MISSDMTITIAILLLQKRRLPSLSSLSKEPDALDNVQTPFDRFDYYFGNIVVDAQIFRQAI